LSRVVIACGASGSGKTHIGEELKRRVPELRIECPDDYRRALSGDVSDQSTSARAFEQAYRSARRALQEGLPVYWSATSLGRKQIRSVLIEAKPDDAAVLLLMDSLDVEMCKRRIREDVASGVDRAVVPDDVVERQHARFLNVLSTIDSFKEELSLTVFTSDELDEVVEFFTNERR
jgi:predicted kinase